MLEAVKGAGRILDDDLGQPVAVDVGYRGQAQRRRSPPGPEQTAPDAVASNDDERVPGRIDDLIAAAGRRYWRP